MGFLTNLLSNIVSIGASIVGIAVNLVSDLYNASMFSCSLSILGNIHKHIIHYIYT
jgi:hypothetical protein